MGTKDEIRRDRIAADERRGKNIRTMVLIGLVMIALGLVLHYSVVGLFDAFKKQHAGQDTSPIPIMADQQKSVPPEPRLQPDEISDLNKLHQSEDDILQTYGWVDRNAGLVRIPIDHALEVLAQRGLPEVAVPNPAATERKPPAGAKQNKSAPTVRPTTR